MTTDLVRFEHNAVATLNGSNDALARLGQWVEAASNAHRLVVPLIDTYFIPDVYRPKVDPRATAEQKAEARAVAIGNATAAVLQGITLGLDPMTALQQIYVVHGRPGMYARIKVALVLSRGHDIWAEDLSDTRAVVAGRRKGGDHIERVVVTMDMARKAGWTKNEAYTKTPQDMLWARAAGRVCDRIAPDALMGIASVEEIQDEVATTSGNGTRTVTPRRRPEPAALPATAEPPLEPEAAPAPAAAEPEPAPRAINASQTRTLHALLKGNEMGDKATGLAYIADVIGRDVASTKDLTRDEAERVIEDLRTPTEEPPLDEAPATQPALDWPDTAQPGGGDTP